MGRGSMRIGLGRGRARELNEEQGVGSVGGARQLLGISELWEIKDLLEVMCVVAGARMWERSKGVILLGGQEWKGWGNLTSLLLICYMALESGPFLSS